MDITHRIHCISTPRDVKAYLSIMYLKTSCKVCNYLVLISIHTCGYSSICEKKLSAWSLFFLNLACSWRGMLSITSFIRCNMMRLKNSLVKEKSSLRQLLHVAVSKESPLLGSWIMTPFFQTFNPFYLWGYAAIFRLLPFLLLSISRGVPHPLNYMSYLSLHGHISYLPRQCHGVSMGSGRFRF